MSYKLGIVINGIRLSDMQLKLIACYCLGLTNEEIYAVINYKPTTLRTRASELYGLFDTGACPHSLVRKMLTLKFDRNGRYDGRVLLDAKEMKLLYKFVPRLLRD